jgi:hypothetical protein
MGGKILQITVSQTELTLADSRLTDDTELSYNLTFFACIVTASPTAQPFFARLTDPGGHFISDSFAFETCSDGTDGVVHKYSGVFKLNSGIDQFVLEFSEDDNFNPPLSDTSVVLAATYGNFRAAYSDGILALTWDAPSTSIRYGQVQVKGDTNVTVNTPEGARGYFLPLPREFFGNDGNVSVFCTPCVKNDSPPAYFFGPPTLPITVMTGIPHIESVDPSDSSNAAFTFTLPSGWGEDASKWKVALVLAPNGEKPDPAGAIPAIPTVKLSDPSTTYSATFDITSITLPWLYTAYLSIASVDGKFSNLDFPQDAGVPLCAPDVAILRHGGGSALTLEFSMAQNRGLTKYEVSPKGGQGDDTFPVNGNKCEIEDASKWFGKALLVTPVFGNKHGVAAEVKLFQKGYYFDSDRNLLVYADSEASYSSRITKYTLPPDCFSKNLTGPIKSDDGLLEIETGGTSLTVDNSKTLVRSDYEEWIKNLFAAELTAEGYYVLRNIVSRTAAIDPTDLEYIQLAINLKQAEEGAATYLRTADIFPGCVLRVLTANFTLQPDKNAKESQGYSPDSAVDFYATLRVKDDAKYIAFDKNLDELINVWGSAFTLGSERKIVYGGAVDFYNTNVKKKFVRIVAPQFGFSPSDTALRGIDAINNMSLYFSDSFEELEEERKQPKSPPGVNYMVFRGRAALSTCVTVCFNGIESVIPAGTTFREYAARHNAVDLKNLTLLRRNGFGELVPVFADSNSIGDIPLLAGDEIC